MKYLLKKDLPWIQSGKIFEENNCQPTCSRYEIDNVLLVWPQFALDNPDFFEPIIEKKTYDDLKKGDGIYLITYTGFINERYFENHCRSEVFLTRQEAEDEHKRREWAVRKDRFIPKEGEFYWYWAHNPWCILGTMNMCHSVDLLNINPGLAFRSKKEAEELLTDEVKRLFYTIR